MRILISAGHSNLDPGAVRKELKEADFVADFRNYVAYYLRNFGLDIITDGDGRINAPLAQAVQLAKKADLAIEFHLNAAHSPTVKGVECLAQEKDRVLCQQISRAIAKVTGTNLRGESGWKPENAGQHSRLKFVQVGGIICEIEFISNKEAMDVVFNNRWVIAKAVAEVIYNYVMENQNG